MPLTSSPAHRLLQFLPIVFFIGCLVGLRLMSVNGDLAGLALALVSGLASVASVTMLIVAHLPASVAMVPQTIKTEARCG